jgi:uncharacterized protein (UPF0264 family)
MTRLLVSVRSAAEAETALAGGADLIDVKEPLNGSLGRADNRVIADVLRCVAGRRPVSAALGEWRERDGGEPLLDGLSYLKWGLSGLRETAELVSAFNGLRASLPICRLVTVAYADWKRAAAPTPEALCRVACEGRWGPYLIDTWNKDGSTLLDWLTLNEIETLVDRCQAAGIPIALAGSLGRREMQILAATEPDWFAVRGAVCHKHQRTATVDEAAVRQFADWLKTFGYNEDVWNEQSKMGGTL